MPQARRSDFAELDEIVENFRRPCITLALAVALGLGWAVAVHFSTVPLDPSLAAVRGLPRLFAVVFGWGSVTLVVVVVMQFAYAYLFMRIKTL